MAEDLTLIGSTKEEVYKSLLPQLKALVEGEPDRTANMANICAGLKEAFHFLWIGFYIVREGELVLGPFQGPVACTRIQKSKGVCGTAWAEKQSVLVPNVDEFPGHIACSSMSKSEIVIPGFNDSGEVIFVLDVDSEHLEGFSGVDQKYLEEVARLVESVW